MKQQVYLVDFLEAFKAVRSNAFTAKGLTAFFKFWQGYEQETGEEIDLDVIAFCYEYTEYKDLAQFQKDYATEGLLTMAGVKNITTVIEIPDTESFIIQNI